jgi:hypothetical protein
MLQYRRRQHDRRDTQRRDLIVDREERLGDLRGIEAKQEKVEYFREIAAGDAHHGGEFR